MVAKTGLPVVYKLAVIGASVELAPDSEPGLLAYKSLLGLFSVVVDNVRGELHGDWVVRKIVVELGEGFLRRI